VDLNWLADRVHEAGGDASFVDSVRTANTANEVLTNCNARGIDIGTLIAADAWKTAAKALAGSGSLLDVVIVDRAGLVVARTTPRLV
jgi:cobalt-precorrin-5B (C1)-methyltransferase